VPWLVNTCRAKPFATENWQKKENMTSPSIWGGPEKEKGNLVRLANKNRPGGFFFVWKSLHSRVVRYTLKKSKTLGGNQQRFRLRGENRKKKRNVQERKEGRFRLPLKCTPLKNRYYPPKREPSNCSWGVGKWGTFGRGGVFF